MRSGKKWLPDQSHAARLRAPTSAHQTSDRGGQDSGFGQRTCSVVRFFWAKSEVRRPQFRSVQPEVHLHIDFHGDGLAVVGWRVESARCLQSRPPSRPGPSPASVVPELYADDRARPLPATPRPSPATWLGGAAGSRRLDPDGKRSLCRRVQSLAHRETHPLRNSHFRSRPTARTIRSWSLNRQKWVADLCQLGQVDVGESHHAWVAREAVWYPRSEIGRLTPALAEQGGEKAFHLAEDTLVLPFGLCLGRRLRRHEQRRLAG